jgi:hypothetical protein
LVLAVQRRQLMALARPQSLAFSLLSVVALALTFTAAAA